MHGTGFFVTISGMVVTNNHGIGGICTQINTYAVFNKHGKLAFDRGYAVSNPAALRFLERNKVNYRLTAQKDPKARYAVFKKAKPFIARLCCPRDPRPR